MLHRLHRILGAAGHVFLAHGLQWGQLFQRCQAQVIEKLPGCRQQCRTARYISVTDDINPATIFQHLDRLRVDRNSANVFDISARHRLTVGNDRQGLERRAGVLRGLFRIQAVEKDLHLGPALESPAIGELHQLHATPGPLLLQFSEHVLDGIGIDHQFLLDLFCNFSGAFVAIRVLFVFFALFVASVVGILRGMLLGGGLLLRSQRSSRFVPGFSDETLGLRISRACNGFEPCRPDRHNSVVPRIEEFFQVVDRQGLVRAQQRSLEDFFRLSGIHLRFLSYWLVAVSRSNSRPASTMPQAHTEGDAGEPGPHCGLLCGPLACVRR